MNQKTTKLVARIFAIILVAVMIITSFTFVFYMSSGSGAVYAAESTASDEAKLNSNMEELQQLIKEIKENYKDDVSYDTLVNGAFNGVMESLDDPYSVYYASTDEEENFVQSVDGEFVGVGVSLVDDNGKCKVDAPIAGTPAAKAGIKSGDIIIKINGEDITKLDIDTVANMIRGESGTKVTLTVNRNGALLSFTMTRETIKTASVDYKMLDGNIGYISISQFDNDSDVEFAAAKKALLAQDADSFIVDVRDNPGGYVSVAADIAEQFMPAGPISYFMQQGKLVDTLTADGSGKTDHPIILLVNENSASASEILAGAWQDSGTAKLVGTTTFGKGIAQQVATLDNGGAIKLSMYYFVTPDKKTINKVGITPDYYVANYNADKVAALEAEYKTFAPMSEKVKDAEGSTGLNVYGAQQRLEMLGYKVTVSGTMDAATVSAVKTFQKQEGVSVCGVLDYSTMNLLETATQKYVSGASDGKDLQLEKAISLLK
jgi:carboxyl-terminal processing protease